MNKKLLIKLSPGIIMMTSPIWVPTVAGILLGIVYLVPVYLLKTVVWVIHSLGFLKDRLYIGDTPIENIPLKQLFSTDFSSDGFALWAMGIAVSLVFVTIIIGIVMIIQELIKERKK